MTAHSYAGLYYPFIHFKDERWLKLSAFYWDQMGRIAPEHYARADSPVVKSLGSFIANIPPNYVSPSFGKRFVEFVGEHGHELRKRYGLALCDKWEPVPSERRPPAAGGSSGSDHRLSYVFYEKMSPDVRAVFAESELARPDSSDQRWIGMHPSLADVYMTAMADQLAADQGLYPVTDEAIDHLAVGGWTMERLAQALLKDVQLVQSAANAREIETLAAYVAVETALPVNIDALPVETILKFRERYPTERATFQRAVRDFVKPREWLNDITDPQVLERRLQSEYDKDLKPKLAQLREKYKDVGIDTAVSVMTIQVAVPAIVVKGAAMLGLVANPIGGLAAGAALALIKVMRDHRKRENELKTADVAYLMRIERDLRPRTVMNWLWEGARKFRLSGPATA